MSSDTLKGISGPDSDEKLVPNIIDKYIVRQKSVFGPDLTVILLPSTVHLGGSLATDAIASISFLDERSFVVFCFQLRLVAQTIVVRYTRPILPRNTFQALLGPSISPGGGAPAD